MAAAHDARGAHRAVGDGIGRTSREHLSGRTSGAPYDRPPLTKENALPFDLWGLLYKDWKPTPEEGVTVFLQGLENRGENIMTKDKLLAIGEKYEAMIAADKAADARYR